LVFMRVFFGFWVFFFFFFYKTKIIYPERDDSGLEIPDELNEGELPF